MNTTGIAVEVVSDALALTGILAGSFWAARSTSLIKKIGVIHPGQVLVLLVCVVRAVISIYQMPEISLYWVFYIHVSTITALLLLILFYYIKAWKKLTQTVAAS